MTLQQTISNRWNVAFNEGQSLRDFMRHYHEVPDALESLAEYNNGITPEIGDICEILRREEFSAEAPTFPASVILTDEEHEDARYAFTKHGLYLLYEKDGESLCLWLCEEENDPKREEMVDDVRVILDHGHWSWVKAKIESRATIAANLSLDALAVGVIDWR